MTTPEKTSPGAMRRGAPDGAWRALLDRRLLSYAAAPALVLAAPAMASAAFTGPYDVSNWTLTNLSADGSVDTSNAPASITITGGDNGTGLPGTTDFTIASAGTGTWSFDWEYTSVDTNDFDGAGWLLNGVYAEVADNASQGTGSQSIAVAAGDIIGFRVRTQDNVFGPGVFTISDFDAPVDVIPPPSVPAPSTLALLALGASGLSVARKRRKAASAN